MNLELLVLNSLLFAIIYIYMYSSMYNCTSDTSSCSYPDHAVLMLISDTNSGLVLLSLVT